jgi:peptidoglycan/xylan/chitin deacetylase (PgdA/CDA1 family)
MEKVTIEGVWKEYMRLIIIMLGLGCGSLYAQVNNYTNKKLIKYLYADSQYLAIKNGIVKQFAHTPAGRWGEFVKGVNEKINTDQKIIAFTFDACGGGRMGNGYDTDLINYLRKEKIPATLFVTGLWIDANYKTFLELAKDTLFEIENHGLNHRPCSINGDSAFGIKGTKNIAGAYDEIEGNAEKIKLITGRKPEFFRSATAYIDEACVKMANMLGITVVSFDVLSEDVLPETSSQTIANNVLKHVKPGSLVIMHFNRPENNTFEALQMIIPQLGAKEYKFVKLQEYPLKSIR